jgi:DNA-binding MurR/RpiR family transcriptional regulator
MSKHSSKKKDKVIIPEVMEPVLSRRHEGVIVALLSNPTIKDAANAASVSESTVWRLMQRDDFLKRYREAQDKAVDGALGALQGAATLAIESLKKNLSCGTPAAEVQAAKAILDFTFKARDQFDHAARLKQLEGALKAREEAERRRGEKEDEDEV